MERKSSILIGGVIVLIVFIVVVGVVAIAAGEMSAETIYFFEEETVPWGADIVHLTEEDYEKFPVLREIPNPIHVDCSIFSSLFIAPGHIDAEMRDVLWNYGSGPYIEHEGVVYQTALATS